MKRVGLVLLALCVPIAVFAEGPATLWTRTYGGPSRDWCTCVRQTLDGGYVLATWGAYDLLKTGANGDSLWSRSFAGEGVSVEQTADGGYILGGSMGDDFWLMKMDADGDSLWSRTYGGSNRDACNAVQQTSDGGYILAGETESFGAASCDFWLVKTDANGDSLWSRTFGGYDVDGCNAVQQTSDGGYMLAGRTLSFGAGDWDYWLVKTDSLGDSLWSRTYGGSDWDECWSAQQTSDGGYVLAGFTWSFDAGSGDFWLVKTNMNGDSLWSSVFGGGGQDWCYSVQQTLDGGYLLAGVENSDGANGHDFWLVKTDANGTRVWDRAIGGNETEWCYSVYPTSDGGCILGGFTGEFPNADIWLVRIASITVSSPNGGQTWCEGSQQSIRWSAVDFTGTVTLSLNRDYPSGGWETLLSGTANDGSESWVVTGPTTTNARIRIISDSQPTQGDTSDANFTIANPYIQVLSPNGTETWYVSESRWLYWTSGCVTGNVDISINRNDPSGAWESLFTNTPNDGSQQWTVTEPTTSTARIRVVSVSNPSARDSSDANFTILSRYIAVAAPDGGEIWHVNDTENVTWQSVNVSGTVSITINFGYPSGPWQNIVSNTLNDGVHPWQVTLPTTTNARIRVISDSYPSVGDTSNGNFTITDQAVITVTSPNGGELWFVGEPGNITWTSGGMSGNIKIELNRDYPNGSWETLFTGTPNDSTEPWPVTGPVTSEARLRVSSVAKPTVTDVSNNNFTIDEDNPPVILHDPKGDGQPGYVLFVAGVLDELPAPTTYLFWRALGESLYDSIQMNATGNPNEYSATLSLADVGTYEYYLKATDVGLQGSTTPVYDFQLYSFCGTVIAYDDGSAERFNWGGAEEFRWAVGFTPASTPFILCGAQVAISRIKPDSAHTHFYIEVYDESGGWPGSLLFSDTTGSIGNVVGGLPPGQTHWADVIIRNVSGEPLVLYDDFFIAVGNPDTLFYEAFARDTTSANSGRSFLYDGCELQWYNENDAWENCKPGNRMIRAIGYYQLPPTVVVYRAGDDAELHWSSTGAPYYRIYSDTTPFGSYSTLEGSTSDTAFTDVGAVAQDIRFYRVVASTTP